MRNKNYSFNFFPSKFLAGTRHLSPSARGYYWDLCCNIWLLTPSQYSFHDTIPNWMNLLGIQDHKLAEELRKSFLNPDFPLFKIRTIHGKKYCIQSGLKKELVHWTNISRRNSKNAYLGHSKRVANMPPQCDRTCDGSATTLPIKNLKKQENQESARKKRAPLSRARPTASRSDYISLGNTTTTTLSDQEVIRQVLLTHLSEIQTNNVMNYLPDITLAYVQEKIAITRTRNPRNRDAYLYSALIQNYTPEEGEIVTVVHPLLKTALHRPLTPQEFASLPDNLRSGFSKIQKQDPPKPIFTLFEYPPEHDFSNKIESMVFKNMAVGDVVDLRSFDQLTPKLQAYFRRSTVTSPPADFYTLEKK